MDFLTMLQIIEYLQKNDFYVYIVSGSDRFLVRALIDGHINLQNEYIIGTEVSIVASHQGEIDGFDYTYTKENDLIFNGTLINKNLNMNKVYNIIKEIGRIPAFHLEIQVEMRVWLIIYFQIKNIERRHLCYYVMI